ncbi:MAG: hypothetical protein ACFFBP_10230 [Promethearchaeota archaeon]
MIEGILCFQFILNQSPSGEIEPEFRPIQLVFKNEQFTTSNYSGLISDNDLFAIFYQHTTGIYGPKSGKGNFYSGRLKETPNMVISYYKQENDGSQYITLSIFDLEDDIDIFEDLIKNLATKLDQSFENLVKAKETNQTAIAARIMSKIKTDIDFTIFQVDRLANLDRLQKAALIFNSEERLAILNILRESPIEKRKLKNELEKIKPIFSIDLLIEPFLELNLVRRDWIKGMRDRQTGRIENQGEYLFLVKDIMLARIPNDNLLKFLKDNNKSLYEIFQSKTIEYFSKYNPLTQTKEETRKLSSLLLNPDVYDFLVLMRKNYYPIQKIPKIFSPFVSPEALLKELKDLNIMIDLIDNEKRTFTLLLTDIKPLVIFPEFLLPKLRKAYRSVDKDKRITLEIAKKALELLEVTYPEYIDF